MIGEILYKTAGYGIAVPTAIGKQLLGFVRRQQPAELTGVAADHDEEVAELSAARSFLAQTAISELPHQDSKAVEAALPEVTAVLAFCKNEGPCDSDEIAAIDPAAPPDEAASQRLMGYLQHAEANISPPEK